MKILVSACLTGENCKYSGGNNLSPRLMELLQGHEIITVCPEVLGGLPIPRIPCEIVNGVVINREGVSCDEEYRRGAEIALETAKREGIRLAVLQPRSPSCGKDIIYDGTFSKTLTSGHGIFAGRLLAEGYTVMTEDEFLEAGGVPEDMDTGGIDYV